MTLTQMKEKVLTLIDSEYASDAAFERAYGLAEKTVNNWRRGKSASFMNLLPAISDGFGVNIASLYDMPLRADTSELSDDELHLLRLYRRSRALPAPLRYALRETLEKTVELYLGAVSLTKERQKEKKKQQ